MFVSDIFGWALDVRPLEDFFRSVARGMLSGTSEELTEFCSSYGVIDRMLLRFLLAFLLKSEKFDNFKL